MERRKDKITPVKQIENSIRALRGQKPPHKPRIEKLLILKEKIRLKEARRR